MIPSSISDSNHNNPQDLNQNRLSNLDNNNIQNNEKYKQDITTQIEVKSENDLNKINLDLTSFELLNQDLWAHYNFNEGSGNTLIDTQGTSNGTIYGASYVTGVEGSALSFDGLTNYADLGMDFGTQGTQSLSFWAKSDLTTAITLAQFSSTSAHVSYSFGVNSEGYYFFGSTNTSVNDWWWTISTSKPMADTWYHFVLVLDDINQSINMFVNGVLELTAPWDGNHYDVTSYNLELGRRSPGGPFYEKLVMDEIRIYNKTLSQTDIENLYSLNSAGFNGQSPSTQFGSAWKEISSYQMESAYTNSQVDLDNDGLIEIFTNSIADGSLQNRGVAGFTKIYEFDRATGKFSNLYYTESTASPVRYYSYDPFGNETQYFIRIVLNSFASSDDISIVRYDLQSNTFVSISNSITLEDGITSMDTYDFDNDNLNDLFLATGYYESSKFTRLELSKTGLLSKRTIPSGINTRSVVVEDVDNDGKMELVVIAIDAGLYIYEYNDITDDFTQSFNVDIAFHHDELWVWDYDNDGKMNIFIQYELSGGADLRVVNYYWNGSTYVQDNKSITLVNMKYLSSLGMKPEDLFGNGQNTVVFPVSYNGNAQLAYINYNGTDFNVELITNVSDSSNVYPMITQLDNDPTMEIIVIKDRSSDTFFDLSIYDYNKDESHLAYFEQFNDDVFLSSKWTRSDNSVITDTTGGYLTIGNNGGFDDWGMYDLPDDTYIIETRSRMTQPLDQYTLGKIYLYDNSNKPIYGTTFNYNPIYGWRIEPLWTKNIRGPFEIFTWYDLRIVISEDRLNATTYVKPVNSDYWQYISTQKLTGTLDKMRFIQHNDVSYEIDFLKVYVKGSTYGPSERDAYTSYVEKDDKIYWFGGSSNGSTNDIKFDEMWIYDIKTSIWTDIMTINRPTGRYAHNLVYDIESDVLILYGGYSTSYLSDTWAFNLITYNWTNMGPSSFPSARSWSSMDYDSVNDRIILFGGYNGSKIGETWSYDYNSNTWTNMNPVSQPPARNKHKIIYDRSLMKFILFGDILQNGDTWSYDYNSNTWANLNPVSHPIGLDHSAMWYDIHTQSILLYGGTDGINMQNQTWIYNSKINNWRKINLSNSTDRVKVGPAVSYVSSLNRSLMFYPWFSETDKTISKIVYSFDFDDFSWFENVDDLKGDRSNYNYIINEQFDYQLNETGWVISEPSVVSDIDSGVAYIGTGGGNNDYLEKSIQIKSLPFTVEYRAKLLSGGLNYRTPWVFLYYTNGSTIAVSYASDGVNNWYLGNKFTGINTNGIPSENVWHDIKVEFKTGEISLYSRLNIQSDYVFITSIPFNNDLNFNKIRIGQPSNSPNEIDYIKIYNNLTKPIRFQSSTSFMNILPTIDGTISGTEWVDAYNFTAKFITEGTRTTTTFDVYIGNDNNYFYIAIASTVLSGWDGFAYVSFDGNNNQIYDGNTLALPHSDFFVGKSSPGGWTGYDDYGVVYNNSGILASTQLSLPTGMLRASAGSSNVGYEYRIPLNVLGVIPGDNIGMSLYVTPNTFNTSLRYNWPTINANRPVGNYAFMNDFANILLATKDTPSAPTGVSSIKSGSDINITWTAPVSDGGSAITNYHIFRSITSGSGYAEIGTSITLNYTDTTGVYGNTYYYVVSAENVKGQGNQSVESSINFANVPDTPTGVSSIKSGSDINVTWSVPISDGGSAITNYRIYRSITSGSGYAEIGTSTTLNYTDTTGVYGNTYYYVVSAENVIGQGSQSAESFINFANVPSAPIGVSTIKSGSNINVTWTAPVSDGGSAITNYRIYRSITSGTGYIEIGTSTTLNYTDTTGVIGNIYYFVLYAESVNGQGSQSAESSTNFANIPGAPTGISSIKSGSDINITWTAPVSDGGSAITNYHIFRSITSGSGYAEIGTSITLNYTDTTGVYGNTYYYVVSAENAIGQGSQSIESFINFVNVPDAPTSVSGLSNETSVILNWTSPYDGGSTITIYHILRSTTSGSGYIEIGTSTINTYNDSSVVFGSVYYYQISAENTIGIGSSSIEISVNHSYIVPNTPQSVTAFSYSGQIVIEWNSPSFDGGTVITAYNVYRTSTSGSGYVLTFIASNTTFIFVDTGLIIGQIYYYVITAENSVGESVYSTEISQLFANVPDAPGNVNLVAGDGTITITWDVPVSTGGIVLINYMIYAGTVSGIYSFVTNTTSLSYIDTGLTNGVMRYYIVLAVNALGASQNSIEKSISPISPNTVPDKPENINAFNSTGGVYLNWSIPLDDGGSVVLSYNIYLYDGTENLLANLVILNYNHATAIKGTIYTYRIRAVNAVGESTNYTEITIQFAGISDAVSISSLIYSDAEVTIAWDLPVFNGGSPITGYNVYRSTSSGDTGLLIGTTTNQFIIDTTVGLNITYYYSVTVINALGESIYSVQSNIKIELPNSLPVSPQNLNVISGNGFVFLQWQNFENSTNDINFMIFRGTDLINMLLLVNTTEVFYNDTSVTNSVGYYYYVFAETTAGISVESNSIYTIPNSPASLPTVINSLNVTGFSGFIKLNWNTTDNGGASIEYYTVYRGTVSGNYISIGSTTDTSFMDTEVEANTVYYYVVTATNRIGETVYSNEDYASAEYVTDFIGTAQNLEISEIDDKIYLSWEAPINVDNLNIIYMIMRGILSGETNDNIYNTTSLNYEDLNIFSGQEYYYTIIIYYNGLVSVKSNEVKIYVSQKPDVIDKIDFEVYNGNIVLNWTEPNGNGDNVTSYNIYRTTVFDGSDYSTFILYTTTASLLFSDTNILLDNTYYYYITSINIKGESGKSDVVTISLDDLIYLPGQPKNLKGTIENNGINLEWNSPDDFGGDDQNVYYNIYRRNEGSYIFIASVEGTSYTDDTFPRGIISYFRISAVNSLGEGNFSNEISISHSQETITSEISNLQITRTVNGLPYLTWDYPNDLSASDIYQFKIYRSLSENNWGDSIGSISGDITFFIDSSAELSKLYYYKIVTVTNSGISEGVIISIEGVETNAGFLPISMLGTIISILGLVLIRKIYATTAIRRKF